MQAESKVSDVGPKGVVSTSNAKCGERDLADTETVPVGSKDLRHLHASRNRYVPFRVG